MASKCPQCGTEVTMYDKKCPECGAPLPENTGLSYEKYREYEKYRKFEDAKIGNFFLLVGMIVSVFNCIGSIIGGIVLMFQGKVLLVILAPVIALIGFCMHAAMFVVFKRLRNM